MTLLKRYQTIILILGDLFLFYLSLYLALSLRYGSWVSQEVWQNHQTLFFFIHFSWLIIFYIVGAYDVKEFISYKKITEKIVKSMSVAGIIAIIIFYLAPITDITPDITPKTNLLVDVLFLVGLLIIWRKLFWSLTKNISRIKILFLGSSKEIKDFAKIICRENKLKIIDEKENSRVVLVMKKDTKDRKLNP